MKTEVVIQCSKCGWLYSTAEKNGAEIPLEQVVQDSWRPILLECTCGARCTILNRQICEPCHSTGAN